MGEGILYPIRGSCAGTNRVGEGHFDAYRSIEDTSLQESQ